MKTLVVKPFSIFKEGFMKNEKRTPYALALALVKGIEKFFPIIAVGEMNVEILKASIKYEMEVKVKVDEAPDLPSGVSLRVMGLELETVAQNIFHLLMEEMEKQEVSSEVDSEEDEVEEIDF